MVTEHMRGVTRHLGQVALRERENTVKKMIIAAIGGALLTGSLLGAGLASADPPYANCAAARADGAAPIYRGDPGYAPHLDRDNGGIACE